MAAMDAAGLERVGVKTMYIEPGSPWENGYGESVNGKLRDELLKRESFDTLLEASHAIHVRLLAVGRRIPIDDVDDRASRRRPREQEHPFRALPAEDVQLPCGEEAAAIGRPSLTEMAMRLEGDASSKTSRKSR